MRRVALGFVLGLSCAAGSSYAGKSKGAVGNCLDSITPIDGYAYFSGNTNPWHNHPAMYAGGSDEDARLTVTGAGFVQAYPFSEIDGAFAAYRRLLVDRGYLPPEP